MERVQLLSNLFAAMENWSKRCEGCSFIGSYSGSQQNAINISFVAGELQLQEKLPLCHCDLLCQKFVLTFGIGVTLALQHYNRRTVKCEFKFTYIYSCFVFNNYCLVQCILMNNNDNCLKNIRISFEAQHVVESLNGMYSDVGTETQFLEALGHSNIPIRKEFLFLEKVQVKGRKKRKISIVADGGWGMMSCEGKIIKLLASVLLTRS